jgi:hypothetical protein
VNNYIEVQTAEGRFNAYLARPAILPAPVIVVVQEIFGVNADVRRHDGPDRAPVTGRSFSSPMPSYVRSISFSKSDGQHTGNS